MTLVSHNLFIPLRIVLNVSAAPVDKDAFEVYPDGDDDDVAVAHDCSIEGDHDF